MLNKIARSLSIRIFFWMMLIMTLGFSLYSFRSVQTHNRQLMENVFLSVNRVSDILKRSMRYGMLTNRKEDVHQIINTVANEPGVDGIRIYNKKGNIVFSSTPAEIGQSVDFRAEACIICHAEAQPLQALPMAERQRIFRMRDGHRTVGVINPIENEPDCYTAACHAHDREQKVLGVLDVKMSLEAVDRQLRQSRRQLILFAGFMIVGTGLAAGVFIYHSVRRRVRALIKGTQEIAAGNLEYRIPSFKQDELGLLAHSFNHMSADLAKAHQEITDWSTHLEEKVEQKSRELAQAQAHMMQMERLASLGKLSATVAHEINNPLAGVLNYAFLALRLLREENLSPERKQALQEYLTIIRNEVGRSGDIVKNMLIFARQTGGNFAAEHLHGLIASSLMLVNHHLELKEITPVQSLQLADDTIVCDGGQIRQALVALFVNATEAMESGGTLTVTTREAQDPEHVTIVVSDTGAGIPAQILPNIFDPFFSTKKEGKGVGLGLAVVFGIIQRHQGSITAGSPPGEGASFRISLPRHPVADSDVKIDKQAIAEI
ncbi:MAG TPA: ATP-binding protein [bacterium]|nr:ATP-binding protein [bacterium]HPR87228.1 ATP-binding protein [bacterium]